MKEHLCPVEKALINYEGECNWCGQKEWVGLTDVEVDTWNIVGHESLREFVRAIEAKLKDKNT